jgi:ArsR family transcriptional regulator
LIDIASYIDICQYAIHAGEARCLLLPTRPAASHDQAGRRRSHGVFHALADSARLRLLSFLSAQPGGEACVCNLTAPVGLSQPTVSHHLKVLNEAGLLAREKRGTWVYYRLVPERVRAVRDALAVPPTPAARASA